MQQAARRNSPPASRLAAPAARAAGALLVLEVPAARAAVPAARRPQQAATRQDGGGSAGAGGLGRRRLRRRRRLGRLDGWRRGLGSLRASPPRRRYPHMRQPRAGPLPARPQAMLRFRLMPIAAPLISIVHASGEVFRRLATTAILCLPVQTLGRRRAVPAFVPIEQESSGTPPAQTIGIPEPRRLRGCAPTQGRMSPAGSKPKI